MKIKTINYSSGYSENIDSLIFATNSYRYIETYWVTGHLKTMLRKLMIKSTPTELDGWPRAADRYIMYANLELAGPKHTKFIP